MNKCYGKYVTLIIMFLYNLFILLKGATVGYDGGKTLQSFVAVDWKFFCFQLFIALSV